MAVKKRLAFFLGFITFVIIIIFCCCLFFLRTNFGSAYLVSKIFKYFLKYDFVYKKADGNLFRQLTLYDCLFDNKVRVQKADVYFSTLDPRSLNIEIHNGRFLLPSSGPVVFDGIYQDSKLDFNFYFQCIDVGDVAESFPMLMDESSIGRIAGVLDGGSGVVKGKPKNVKIEGKFFLHGLSNGIFVIDSLFLFDVRLKNDFGKIGIYGDIILKNGTVKFPYSRIDIKEGKFIFDGDPLNPLFDILAHSRIDETSISIVLKGDRAHPQLLLTSDPPKSQQMLMVMLATGKSWSKTESSVEKGEISVDALSDFIDFFLFGNSASDWAKQLGISGISFEPSTKTVGLTCKVTDNISGSINQAGVEPAPSSVVVKYKTKF